MLIHFFSFTFVELGVKRYAIHVVYSEAIRPSNLDRTAANWVCFIHAWVKHSAHLDPQNSHEFVNEFSLHAKFSWATQLSINYKTGAKVMQLCPGLPPVVCFSFYAVALFYLTSAKLNIWAFWNPPHSSPRSGLSPRHVLALASLSLLISLPWNPI